MSTLDPHFTLGPADRGEGFGDGETYRKMVLDDVGAALDVAWPVHEESGGTNRSVSLEQAPALAHDTAA